MIQYDSMIIVRLDSTAQKDSVDMSVKPQCSLKEVLIGLGVRPCEMGNSCDHKPKHYWAPILRKVRKAAK